MRFLHFIIFTAHHHFYIWHNVIWSPTATGFFRGCFQVPEGHSRTSAKVRLVLTFTFSYSSISGPFRGVRHVTSTDVQHLLEEYPKWERLTERWLGWVHTTVALMLRVLCVRMRCLHSDVLMELVIHENNVPYRNCCNTAAQEKEKKCRYSPLGGTWSWKYTTSTC